MSDEEYTDAVDGGTYDNFINDKAGYGLAQWTYWSRKQALLLRSHKTGESIGNLPMQLGFLWEELQGYTAVMEVLKKAGSVRSASDAVLTGYEKPADQSEAVKKKRAEYGEVYYKKVTSRQWYKVLQSAQELDGCSKPAGGVYIIGKWQRALAKQDIPYMMITARQYIRQAAAGSCNRSVQEVCV